MTALEFFQNLCDRKIAAVSLIIIKSPCHFFPNLKSPDLSQHYLELNIQHLIKRKLTEEDVRCQIFLLLLMCKPMFVNLEKLDHEGILSNLINWILVLVLIAFPSQYLYTKAIISGSQIVADVFYVATLENLINILYSFYLLKGC